MVTVGSPISSLTPELASSHSDSCSQYHQSLDCNCNSGMPMRSDDSIHRCSSHFGGSYIQCGSQKSVKHILQELETALMGPEYDDTDLVGSVSGGQGANQKGEWKDSLDELLSKSFRNFPYPVDEQVHASSGHFSYSDNQQY
eukprot:c929_g1_i2 orf=740-1165(+)